MAGRKNARAAGAGPAEASLTKVADQPSFKVKRESTPIKREIKSEPRSCKREPIKIKREPSPSHDGTVESLASEITSNSSSSVPPRQRSKGKQPVVTSVEENEVDDAPEQPMTTRELDDIRALLLNIQATQVAQHNAIEQRLRNLEERIPAMTQDVEEDEQDVHEIDERQDPTAHIVERLDTLNYNLNMLRQDIPTAEAVADIVVRKFGARMMGQ